MKAFGVLAVLCVVSVTAIPSRRYYQSKRGSLKDKFNPEDLSDKPTCPKRFSLISEDHTACLNPPTRAVQGVSVTDKKLIVEKHNYYRGNVEKFNNQPPARNMQKMVWDDELAELAQKWASNCIWRHEETYNRNLPGFYPVGQNLARGFSQWKGVLSAWHDEVYNFEYGHGSTNGDDIGHYTQLVWAESSRVGCGYAVCNGSIPYFACDYGPSGNYVDRQFVPYKKATSGAKGSSCARTYKPREGLCDCNGKVCKNGGHLDLNTCTCNCKARSWITKSDCSLNCTIVGHDDGCKTLGEERCKKWTNYPYEYCPVTCHLCPVDCSKANDFFICKHAGGSWGERECKKWTNVPYDYCPITCHLCPAPGEEENFFEVQGDEHQLGMPQNQPDNENDYNPENEEITTTTPAPTRQPTRPTRKPVNRPTTTRTTTTTTTTPAPTTTAKEIDDGLKPCTFIEPAKCGQPSESYWPKHYCKYGIWRKCQAMCGKCAATKCQDYEYNEYNVGQTWVNEFGKFTCTRNGVENQRGCLIEDLNQFVSGGDKHVYYDGKYTWTCHCDAQDYGLTCKGKWGKHV